MSSYSLSLQNLPPGHFGLFLDDNRFPPDSPAGVPWVVVRSVGAAKAWVLAHPNALGFVSFDNDLGPDEPEGWTFARWLVDWDLDERAAGRPGLHQAFAYYAHSKNWPAAEHIRGLLDQYLQVRLS